MVTHIFLLIILSSDDTVHAVHEKLAKLLHLVALPVVHSAYKIVQGFVKKSTVDSIVGLVQYSLRSFATSDQIGFDFLILGLLVQILWQS